MSRWITLNVQTDDTEAVQDLFPEMRCYEPEDIDAPDMVCYTFMSRSLGDSQEQALRHAARVAIAAGATGVLGIIAGDTADWATYYGFDVFDGQVIETRHGFVNLYQPEQTRMLMYLIDEYGFNPDLGGNYRRPECEDYSFYNTLSNQE